MPPETPPDPPLEPPPGRPSNRAFVVGLLFAAVLAVAGVALVTSLVGMARLQDCAITGRTNC